MGQGTSQDRPVPTLLSSLRQPHGHAAAVTLKRDYIRKFNTLPSRVCPTEEEEREACKAVNLVVKLLHHQLRPAARVDRVHVGGSFGRRTSVRFRFDVDLLLFVNGLKADYKDQVQRLMQQVKQVLVAGRVNSGPVKLRPELCMVQLTSGGVGMDVMLVHNEVVSPGPNVDRKRVQRDVLVGPLLHGVRDVDVRAMAQKPVDRSRERGVVEALTKYVARQHTTANQAVRIFKAWVKLALAEGGQLRSKKLPSVALELIVLRAYQDEKAAGGPSDTLLLRTFVTPYTWRGSCGEAGSAGRRWSWWTPGRTWATGGRTECATGSAGALRPMSSTPSTPPAT